MSGKSPGSEAENRWRAYFDGAFEDADTGILSGVRVECAALPGVTFTVDCDLIGRRLQRVEVDYKQGISVELWRAVPLAELHRFVRTSWAEYLLEAFGGRYGMTASPALAERFMSYKLRPNPGRRPRAVDDYLALVIDYVSIADKVPNPIDVLHERHHESKANIRKMLFNARRPPLDLLTAAPSGQQGGALTPKALELLKEKGTNDGEAT